MHELALAQGVVDIVEAQARVESFTRVRRIVLTVGALSHVEPEALRFGFESASRGTRAEGAELRIDRPEGGGTCMGCGEDVTLTQRGDACPRCGSYQVLVTSGEELRVAELEVV